MTVYTDIVRSALAELADDKHQRRVWTGGRGSEQVSSFEECVEQLFDDSGLDIALERNEPVYGSAINDDLKYLGVLLSRIDGQRSAEEVIDDPLMTRVRQLAAKILRAIDDDGTNPVLASGDIGGH